MIDEPWNAQVTTFHLNRAPMKKPVQPKLKDGDHCQVVGGTHEGKSGTVNDINTSKTGHITITVVQKNGDRFKTLGKNVVVKRAQRG